MIIKASKQIVFLTLLVISFAHWGLASDTNAFNHPARRLLPAAWKATWSPDSKKLAFTRHNGTNVNDASQGISVLDLESGTVTNLTTEGKDPAWSPDGRFIAYVANESAVLVIPIQGGEPVRLGSGNWPMWTPDSKHVLFTRTGVLSMALDAPKQEPKVFFPNPRAGYPSVSPDGSRIACGSEKVLNVFDTKTEQLIASLPHSDYLALTGWSPNGRHVAFGGAPSDRFGLWIFDVQRGGAYQVATNGTRPAWSPDGKRLVYDVESGSYNKGNWKRELWVIETATLPRNPVLTNQIPPRVVANQVAPHVVTNQVPAPAVK